MPVSPEQILSFSRHLIDRIGKIPPVFRQPDSRSWARHFPPVQVFPQNQFLYRGLRRTDPKHTFILMTDEKERGNNMDGLVPEDEPCEQCGLCCRIFGPGISPTTANVYLWIEQGRTDILRWFVANMEDTTQVPCADLSATSLGNVVSFEMRHMDTGEYVTVCPFLRRVAKERYLCGIHAVKPEMCCTYQPWVWGETYFNRCPALRKADRKCRWPL